MHINTFIKAFAFLFKIIITMKKIYGFYAVN